MSNPQILRNNVIDIFPKTKEEKFLNLLSSFKISVEEVYLESNDNFDLYSIRLSPGSKISKLEKVLPEIGLQLRALSTPRGRLLMEEGLYEISVQIGRPQSIAVSYANLLDNNPEFLCPISFGVDEFGSEMIHDLNQMPNLLVAGTTGSGKSMFLHSIFLSVAANNADIYLIDPKGVEFDQYRELSCISAFASDLLGAKKILSNLYTRMENIFSILQKVGARNLAEYNNLVREKIKPSVLIIDEWADLVLQDKSIQNDLCLIAQKGRAAGVSIVLATQRPSASIISGPIKANFPARVAMRVASLVDSRVILDSSGAEKLAKVGSGIYLDPKTGEQRLFFAPKVDSVSSEIKKLGLKKTNSFWKKLWG